MKAMIECLKSMDVLLADENHWSQGAQARDKRRRPTSPHNPKACMFCLIGAADRVTKAELQDFLAVTRMLGRALPGQGPLLSRIANFNDNATFAEVKALLKKLIDKEEAA